MGIPSIDVASLFEGPSPQRAMTDAAIFEAATATGFMTITGLPASIAPSQPVRQELLRLFRLSVSDKAKLLRQTFDPRQANVYRGFFPLQDGGATYKEGIDMGPDVADPGWTPDPSDPLTEATPFPSEAALPGWRTAAGLYYRGMEQLGATIMRSLARSLGLAETVFDDAFNGGISTLRLIRYPVRPETAIPPAAFVVHDGARRSLIGGAHVDSGFVTLLAQDGVEGLQAKAGDGSWIDVPPIEGSLAVNFGGLLERWIGGRIKATEHRVLSPGRERFSIPFFYEPRVDGVIRPMPGGADFAPFTYGDHLWSAMTKFVEFEALKDARAPRRVAD
jgi:isopenicillin N synthase-like dioxygenase